MSLRRELGACIDLLLPPACHFCGEQLATPRASDNLCPDCRASIPILEACCRCCARPFSSFTPTRHLCEPCLRTPPAFTRVYTIGRHSGVLQENIHRLKYHSQLILAGTFARLLCNRLNDDAYRPDLVIPVPLHPKRLRQRGYNQALELARPLARQLDATLEKGALIRQQQTPPQQGLSLTERTANLKNAFACTAPLSAQRILLVDDVMTSGTTVKECARVLAESGVCELRVAVIGRA